MTKTFIASLMMLLSVQSYAQTNPVELGDVHWLRNLDQAKEKSNKSGKPILILFQEIPGCSTCQRYGSDVMRHPMIVEAIENEFIPLAIHNNKSGDDAKVLAYFNEPSWNNPVVRIVNAKLDDLQPRLNGDYSAPGVTDYMIHALKAIKAPVPAYLQLLASSFSTSNQEITFGMYCFWEGEGKLGALNGVTKTEPGYVDGHEVVKVSFDPNYISPEKLINEAGKMSCSSQIYADAKNLNQYKHINSKVTQGGNFKSDGDPQYYLKHTEYRCVPMLSIQASRVNAAIGHASDPDQYLSPKQIAMAEYFKGHANDGNKEAYHTTDFIIEWNKALKSMKIKS